MKYALWHFPSRSLLCAVMICSNLGFPLSFHLTPDYLGHCFVNNEFAKLLTVEANNCCIIQQMHWSAHGNEQ